MIDSMAAHDKSDVRTKTAQRLKLQYLLQISPYFDCDEEDRSLVPNYCCASALRHTGPEAAPWEAAWHRTVRFLVSFHSNVSLKPCTDSELAHESQTPSEAGSDAKYCLCVCFPYEVQAAACRLDCGAETLRRLGSHLYRSGTRICCSSACEAVDCASSYLT